MATSKVLQTPSVISIDGSTIRIAHPDVSQYTRAEVIVPHTAAATALSVSDNNNFADDDWFILGEIADAKTEECDVNGAVTRGQSLTITNSTKFNHEIHAPVTKIQERKIKIYGAATDGGAGTLIASIDALSGDAFGIQWNRPFSEYTLVSTDTAYAYYYAVFTDGTTDSPASDYVLAAGLPHNSAMAIVKQGLDEVKASIDGLLITNEWLLAVANDCQEEVTRYVDENDIPKDWSFEIAVDETSLTADENVEAYAVSALTPDLKYPQSNQGILSVRLGSKRIDYADSDEIDEAYEGIPRTDVATQAEIGATSIVLDDVSEFTDSGTFKAPGGQTVTFTGRTVATNTLTGIPASGTGSITAVIPVDSVIWQNISPGTPNKYTIINGEIVFNLPIGSAVDGQKIKIRYVADRGRMSSLSDTFTVTPVYHLKYFIAARIESRKGNIDNSMRLEKIFRNRLAQEAAKDRSFIEEQLEYYHFKEHGSQGRNRLND